MTSGSPTSKKCPKCHTVDVTTFSSCRNCGTKYDYKPPEKTRDFNFIPIVIVAGLVVIAASAYQYIQVNNLYKRPDQLIGKTVACKANSLFVSTEKSNLLSLDQNDFKILNHSGADDNQGSSDAAALNRLASISGEISVWQKYLHDPRFTLIQKNAKDPPFSVKVVAATAPTDKYSLAQVEFLNGPKAGSVWWVDSSRLDLSVKNR